MAGYINGGFKYFPPYKPLHHVERKKYVSPSTLTLNLLTWRIW
jgi:hypothetical protein